MLVVVQRGREREVESIFHAWDLTSAVIGEVTDDGQLTVMDGADQVARVPIRLLTEGAPVRHLAAYAPEPPFGLDIDALPPVADPGATLLHMLASPNLSSRRGVFRRYDHMVGDATVIAPGGDAAMLRVKGTRLGLAVTTDCNARYCHLDPHLGAQLAVAEAARNIVATGARPLAVTDCLNFANPDRPEVYWELEEAIAGLAYACRSLELPVVSGNVSLYNDSNGTSAIYPTPVVGMVGVIDDYDKRLGAALRVEGDFVLLIGSTHNDLGGTEYLKVEHGHVAGRPPALDLTREKAVNRLILAAAQSRYLHSAHDCADGGMLVALAECCLLGGIGVANLTYFGLFALQHRGQESAGIAVSDGASVRVHRDMGLVAQVFSAARIKELGEGSILALGHTRYSTTGSSRAENAHPLPFRHPSLGPGAIAHNGNLLNAESLRTQLEDQGVVFETALDTEVMARLIENTHGRTWEEVIRRTFARVVGAYSCGIITPNQLIALRDPFGFRPLCIGYIPLPGQPAHVIASETCALDTVRATFVREVQPGEMVVMDEHGVHSVSFQASNKHAMCVFEFIYFARP